MADHFQLNQLNIGVLRSQMTLKIHTRQASRLWYGRKHTSDKPGIMGLYGFLLITNQINDGSRQDDPYSDWWMLRIEEHIDRTTTQLKALKEKIDHVFEKIPPTLSISENFSVDPASLPVYAGSHLGYLAIYILAQYDEISRKALLARHIALVDRLTFDEWLDQGDHVMRSLFGLSLQYRYSGVSRKDFLEKNAAAKAAIDKLGEVPQEVMSGIKRSRFSPPIRTDRYELNEIDQNLEEETQEEAFTLIVPTETEFDALEADANNLSELSKEAL